MMQSRAASSIRDGEVVGKEMVPATRTSGNVRHDPRGPADAAAATSTRRAARHGDGGNCPSFSTRLATLVMSWSAPRALGIRPKLVFRGFASPAWSRRDGIGPSSRCPKLLKRAASRSGDIDVGS